jgi:hypothetical protein
LFLEQKLGQSGAKQEAYRGNAMEQSFSNCHKRVCDAMHHCRVLAGGTAV